MQSLGQELYELISTVRRSSSSDERLTDFLTVGSQSETAAIGFFCQGLNGDAWLELPLVFTNCNSSHLPLDV